MRTKKLLVGAIVVFSALLAAAYLVHFGLPSTKLPLIEELGGIGSR